LANSRSKNEPSDRLLSALNRSISDRRGKSTIPTQDESTVSDRTSFCDWDLCPSGTSGGGTCDGYNCGSCCMVVSAQWFQCGQLPGGGGCERVKCESNWVPVNDWENSHERSSCLDRGGAFNKDQSCNAWGECVDAMTWDLDEGEDNAMGCNSYTPGSPPPCNFNEWNLVDSKPSDCVFLDDMLEDGFCDCNGREPDDCGSCEGSCYQIDGEWLSDGSCGCIGSDGTPCTAIADGACDCSGNVLDDCGICGGSVFFGTNPGDSCLPTGYYGEGCPIETTPDGSLQNMLWIIDCAGNCKAPGTGAAIDECGKCGGPGKCPCGVGDTASSSANGISACCCCESGIDMDQDGIHDCVDDCVVNTTFSQTCGCNTPLPAGACSCEGHVLNECGVCGGPGKVSCIFDASGETSQPDGHCDCSGNKCDKCGVCGGTSDCLNYCAGTIPCHNYDVDDCPAYPLCKVGWEINESAHAFGLSKNERIRLKNLTDSKTPGAQESRLPVCNADYAMIYDAAPSSAHEDYVSPYCMGTYPCARYLYDDWSGILLCYTGEPGDPLEYGDPRNLCGPYSSSDIEKMRATVEYPLPTWRGTTTYNKLASGAVDVNSDSADGLSAGRTICEWNLSDGNDPNNECDPGKPSHNGLYVVGVNNYGGTDSANDFLDGGCKSWPLGSFTDSNGFVKNGTCSQNYKRHHCNGKIRLFEGWQKIGCSNPAHAGRDYYRPPCLSGDDSGDGTTLEDTYCFDIHDGSCCFDGTTDVQVAGYGKMECYIKPVCGNGSFSCGSLTQASCEGSSTPGCYWNDVEPGFDFPILCCDGQWYECISHWEMAQSTPGYGPVSTKCCEEHGTTARPCGCGCFVEDTLISTPNGEIPIQDLKFGDEVYTFKNSSEELFVGRVDALISHNPEEDTFGLYKLITDNNEVIVTGNHLFVQDGKNPKWSALHRMNVGDKLYVENGNVETIISLEKLDYKKDTFNLMIDDTHTYIANGFRVHNAYSKKNTNSITRQEYINELMDTPSVKDIWDEDSDICRPVPDDIKDPNPQIVRQTGGKIENIADSGITSSDEGHTHEYQIDYNGNGWALEAYHPEESRINHKHEIINWIVQEAKSRCYPKCMEQYGVRGVKPHIHYISKEI
jgi:hypothetical protein